MNKGLADTLAGIGDAEGEALRAYNEGLANIAGAKDARDMENELAKITTRSSKEKQAQAYINFLVLKMRKKQQAKEN